VKSAVSLQTLAEQIEDEQLELRGLGFGWAEAGEEGEGPAPRRSPRRLEFAAGREAARLALRRVGGNQNAALAVGPRGIPEWPSGWRGSLAHSRGLAIAFACKSEFCDGVGADLEHFGRLRPRTVSHVCRPRELEGWSGEAQARVATCLFSLKEAFYKYQSPLLGLAPRFQDLVFSLEQTDEAHSPRIHVVAREGILAAPELDPFFKNLDFRLWQTDALVCSLVERPRVLR